MKNIKKVIRKVTHTFMGFRTHFMQLGWYITLDRGSSSAADETIAADIAIKQRQTFRFVIESL